MQTEKCQKKIKPKTVPEMRPEQSLIAEWRNERRNCGKQKIMLKWYTRKEDVKQERKYEKKVWNERKFSRAKYKNKYEVSENEEYRKNEWMEIK